MKIFMKIARARWRKMLDFIGVKDIPEKVLRDAVYHNSIDELRKRETGGVYSTGRLQPRNLW